MCRMKRHHVDMVFSLYNHVRRFCGVLVGMLHSRSLVFQEWIMVFTPSDSAVQFVTFYCLDSDLPVGQHCLSFGELLPDHILHQSWLLSCVLGQDALKYT